MKCPNCGNEIFERLDYAVVRCANCLSLWDPYIYPGFPEPNVEPGKIWDTTPSTSPDWMIEQEYRDDETDDWEDWDEIEENDDPIDS